MAETRNQLRHIESCIGIDSVRQKSWIQWAYTDQKIYYYFAKKRQFFHLFLGRIYTKHSGKLAIKDWQYFKTSNEIWDTLLYAANWGQRWIAQKVQVVYVYNIIVVGIGKIKKNNANKKLWEEHLFKLKGERNYCCIPLFHFNIFRIVLSWYRLVTIHHPLLLFISAEISWIKK